MKEIDSERMVKIITISGSIAMLIFLYMVTTFFRLEWVRYDVVDRNWKVESMLCENLPTTLTLRLYKKNTTEADFTIHFSEAMFIHLGQQPEKTVAVARKLTGYLREWDYGIIMPLTIAEKEVAKQAYISRQQSQNCNFQVVDKTSQKVTDTRRKMR